MTPRQARTCLACSLATALLVLSLGLSRLTSARTHASAADARLAQLRLDAQRVLDLRSRAQTISAGEQPAQDVFQRASALLTDAALTRARVQSVTPAGDRALGDGRREQSVRISIAPLTLADLGSLLNRWRRTQSLWTLRSIELTARPGRSAEPGAYAVTLTAAAQYLESSPPPQPTAQSTRSDTTR